MRVLIVENGKTTAALSATRALGREGWVVGIGSPEPRGLAASSRYCSRWHEVPAPGLSFQRFVAAVNDAANEGAYELVFPAGDAELLALSFARDQLLPRLPYPSHESVLLLLDKLSFAAQAANAGIATPHTVVATDEALDAVDRPVVVKARLHSIPGTEGATERLEAMPVAGRADAARRCAEITSHGGVALIQEFVSGRLVVYTAVCDQQGQIVASIQHVAERISPPGAGYTCRGYTVPVDPEIEASVQRLLKSAGWFGLAQLQYLQPDGDAPNAIDFNGRFYASMAIASAAGLNLPAAWASLATGRPLPESTRGVAGIRYQDFLMDLFRARRERRRGLVGDVFDCLWNTRGRSGALWAADDRRPLLAATGDIGSRLTRRAAGFVTGALRRAP